MAFGRRTAQPRVSQVKSFIAPLGGINDLDPIANMSENYCLQMVNWLPGNSAIVARQGYRDWVTNLGLPVRTIMPYYTMDGSYKLFAATDGGIYDATAATDTPTKVHDTANGYYKFVTFGNVAFQYLVAVNGGSEPSVLFDGTAWIDFEESQTPASPGQIKGVDPATFSHVTAFKRRLWFVQEDSATAWYLPVDATSGEAKPFYLTSIFKRGGKLVYIIDWSVDAGDGLDDKLIFVSNLGEVAIYSGTDPDVTNSWGLSAVFYASAPVGERSFAEFGGDVLMTTTIGIISLNKVLIGAVENTPTDSAISKLISNSINRLVTSKKYLRNWELHNVPALQAVVIVVPPVGTEPALQFVMNSLTGAWARADMPINCAAGAAGDFYFGTVDGRVCIYGGGNYLDDVQLDGSGGTPVQCSLFSAYSSMGDPTTLKHWKLIRPIFQSDQPPSYLVRLNTDYDISALPGNPSPPADDQQNPLWDTAIWDNAYWSSSYTVYRPWVGVSAMGFSCALLMKAATNDLTSLVAIEFVYEAGGSI